MSLRFPRQAPPMSPQGPTHFHTLSHGYEPVDRSEVTPEVTHGPKYFRIIVNRKVTSGVNETIAFPRINELWLCESLAANGQVKKSPGFALRSNTGNLIACVPKEGVGQEPFNGCSVILPRETLILEPAESGNVDFVLCVRRIKVTKQMQDAGQGISAKIYQYRPHDAHGEIPHSDSTVVPIWEPRERTGAVE